MKLGLGTVQFGLDYGVTNQSGRIPLPAANAMLEYAAANGVEVLDTAALYGEAESVLGTALPRPHPFRIVSKTLPLDPALPPEQTIAAVVAGVRRSLERLREPKLAGLLVHRPGDLIGEHGEALFAALSALRDEGLVEKVGVSVYTADEIRQILARHAIELVQLPLNALDQRPLQSGAIEALRERGVEVHIRSAFLQGLLLAPPERIPPQLAALQPALAAWHARIHRLGLTPLTATLGFLKGIAGLGTVLCGATQTQEWQEVVAAFAAAPALPQETFADLAITDEALIDPRHWPKP